MCVAQARVRERGAGPGRPPEGFRGGNHVESEAAARPEARCGRAEGEKRRMHTEYRRGGEGPVAPLLCDPGWVI